MFLVYKSHISLFVLICFLGVIIGPVLLYPRTANAFVISVSKNVMSEIHILLQKGWEVLKKAWRYTIGALKEWDKVMKILKWAQGKFLYMFLMQLLAQLTNDLVMWIQNGTKPRFLTEKFGDWLKRAANNVAGDFINRYLGMGWLCEPFDLNLKISLMEAPLFEERAQCTISDIVANINDFRSDFSQGGWGAVISVAEPQNNFYGAYLTARAEKHKIIETEQAEREMELQMGSGYLTLKECTWYDMNGIAVEVQKNVQGTPPFPDACRPIPNNPNHRTRGGYTGPCVSKCTILTPASSHEALSAQSITGIYDQINELIGAAAAKAGPFGIYVQAIGEALVSRITKSSMGLLRAGTEGDELTIPDHTSAKADATADDPEIQSEVDCLVHGDCPEE